MVEPSIRKTTDSQGVITLWMDVPEKSVNTCTPALLDELEKTVAELETNPPAALIIASAKPTSFNAGADLFEIRQMSREQLNDYIGKGQAVFDRISKLGAPTIAAINGNCMGGGFELALACRYRVAADDTSITIGLPETKLGLIPAWGGTTRLPRLIGLMRALPILLAGKTMPPRKAQRAGLVDEVVRREALLVAAKRIVLSRAQPQRPSKTHQIIERFGVAREKILQSAKKQTQETTYGNYPAPMRLIDVLQTGYEKGIPAGLEAERREIGELASSEVTRNLMRIFFLRQGAKREAMKQVTAKPAEAHRAAVIGGGTMGAGIAHALARSGIPVRLIEVNAAAMSGGLQRIRKMLDDDVSSGRLDKIAARDAMNRVSPCLDWTGLELVDLVVEAALESMPIKREIFARLDRTVKPGTVLCSNTSSLSVSEMAQATLHPERVVGLHFFNPVPKMPLVEIVRGAESDDQSLAAAIGLCGKIGKTPVLVNDSPGFVVNRILIPYLSEALIMGSEGIPVPDIDEAAKRWGMPMGPFELLDEVGLDVGALVLASLHSPAGEMKAIAGAMELAKSRGWLGKKSGRGFYIHEKKKGAKLKLNDELVRALNGRAAAAVEEQDDLARKTRDEATQWRLVLPMVNEMAKLREENPRLSDDAIDLATVMGLGLAPFRGGLAQFAKAVGNAELVRRLDDLSSRHGPRFTAARSLRESAPSPDVSDSQPQHSITG